MKEREGEKAGSGDRTPEVKHSLTTTNWLSQTNSRVFNVLFIPLAAQYKRPSVICATVMNRSTSSAKSKTCGHSRRHRRFVNRQGCLGVTPAVALCRSSTGASRVAGAGYCRGGAGQQEGPLSAELQLREAQEKKSIFLCNSRVLFTKATWKPRNLKQLDQNFEICPECPKNEINPEF